jgi:Mrp family chromosome partitioning ATPase
MPAPREETSLPAIYEGTEAAAAFRGLRHALEAAASSQPVRKIVVTGVRPDDANVWLGANLAIALAHSGSRVLLVDGRLGDRHGRPMAAEPDTPGLYDVLQGVHLARAISPGPVERLAVLPAGNAGGAPVERIMERRFSTLTAEATDLFDIVVVLAPALSVGSDAVVMAVDGAVLLGVRSGSVSAAELREHSMHMRSTGLQLLGSVLFTRGRRR